MFLALYLQSPLNTSLYTIHPLKYIISRILYIIYYTRLNLPMFVFCKCSLFSLYKHNCFWIYFFVTQTGNTVVIYQNNSFWQQILLSDMNYSWHFCCWFHHWTKQNFCFPISCSIWISQFFAAVFLHFTALWDLVSKGQNRLMSGVWGRSSVLWVLLC